ncbi:MAG TPA: PEP-CTERM sorting domain-containing protein [Phycisphaerae bacterium]|nr:PEP-CTERM sorting domain-containing protein [Phycisphaerae bacterium]
MNARPVALSHVPRTRRAAARPAAALIAAALLAVALPAWAVDIDGVQPAALDQPQINMVLTGDDGLVKSFTGLGIDPVTGDLSDNVTTFTITAYLDTGSGSFLLSQDTATSFGIGSDGATLVDVGVGGPANFEVSENLHVALANYFPRDDLDQFDSTGQPILAPYAPLTPAPGNTGYHVEVGPLTPPSSDDIDSIIAGLNSVDVVGMPALKGKVLVIDPKPTNGIIDVINGLSDPNADFDTIVTQLENSETRTYIYNPAEPFHPATQDNNPGIPTTNLHVKLSYADFSRFTPVSGGVGPDMVHNPFIGADPVAIFDHTPTAPTPGIKITRTVSGPTGDVTLSSEGSWLFDTGAAANFISQAQAANLGVHYKDGTYQTDTPELVDADGVDIPDQFTLPIGGIGATQTVAGFWLDSMLVRTVEGGGNDDDPHNLLFHHVPVLVLDISLLDPVSGKTLTLDGDFAMNNLLASANIDTTDPNDLFPIFDPSTTPFNWVVFDEPNGMLGLDVDPSLIGEVPEPASLGLLGLASLLLLRRRK